MNEHDPVVILGNVIVIAGWLPSFLFVVLYAFRSNWRKYVVGRALLLKSFAFLLVMTTVLIGIWFPDLPGRSIIRLVTYSFWVITMWGMLFVLIHYQREEKGIKRKLEESIKAKDYKPFL